MDTIEKYVSDQYDIRETKPRLIDFMLYSKKLSGRGAKTSLKAIRKLYNCKSQIS